MALTTEAQDHVARYVEADTEIRRLEAVKQNAYADALEAYITARLTETGGDTGDPDARLDLRQEAFRVIDAAKAEALQAAHD